ncbi:cysteine synthase [Oceanidesulfovibrio marinus]|uniref:cysteine synthase n=1 Tax=Oceanidesulfovibrio marinus TaxID=370038 RepID=A0A6P1ZPH8_9BACT|nr:cysteine synthase [Oceanidesulfovibrio marinus]TVM36455.1 cysteine synthase [Oceanidesulfovibrio marinus]
MSPVINADVLQAIGNTPLVTINRMNPNPRVKILAKLEGKNPGGSIKDRVGLALIEAAEKSGELVPGKIVIEATSGNTGIGLAMVCAVKGYPLRLLMASTASRERKQILLAYGASIQLTPGHLSTDGAIEEAYRMAREEPDKYVLMDQFNNRASIDAHYYGTGLEIWEQTGGEVTHVVATLGTSGTVMGITKRLKEMNPATKMIALEPRPGHKIQGLKNMHASYPPGIFDRHVPDEIRPVDDEESFEACRRLAREEGLLVGMSSGAAMAGAMRLAKELDSGTIVVLFPDGGERYLSTPLFAPPPERGVRVFDLARGESTIVATETMGEAPTAGFFTIGPALDRLGDLDAWRRILSLDLMTRYLNGQGRKAKAVVSLADLDDSALKAARAAGLSRKEHAGRALDQVKELAARLGVSDAVSFHLAGNHQETALDICRKLLAKGAAYEKLRSVYFDVLRYADYGRMTSMDLEKISLGKTVDLAEYAKDNPKDFTLLKRASLEDLKHDDIVKTEWGNVRPSWFLQHAAVAADTLGEIAGFMASEAHVFPHLENFRAILAIGRSLEPGAWLVANHVTSEIGGAELADLLRDAPARLVRMWYLSTSYRKPLSLSDKSFAMWKRNHAKVLHAAGDLHLAADGAKPLADTPKAAAALEAALGESLEDDLSLHRFWPELFSFCRTAAQLGAHGAMNPAEAASMENALLDVDAVLGVLGENSLPLPATKWPAEVAALVAEREQARQDKDFGKADELRDILRSKGYEVEDAPQGTRLFPTQC